MKSEKKVSVIIIPHFNDESRLAKLLASIAIARTDPFVTWQTIVVDDNSRDPAIAKSTAATYGAMYVQGSGNGSYAARNIGIRAAGVIDGALFTDSDCILSEETLAAYAHWLLGSDSRLLAAGPIDLFPKDLDRPNRWEALDISTGLPQERKVKQEGIAVTANLFVRASCFKQFGLFNEQYRSGGDVEFTRTVAARSGGIAWIPQAKVLHPARDSRDEHVKKMRRVQSGLVARDRSPDGKLPFSKFIKHFGRAISPPLNSWHHIAKSRKIGAKDKLLAGLAAAEQKLVRTSFVLGQLKRENSYPPRPVSPLKVSR